MSISLLPLCYERYHNCHVSERVCDHLGIVDSIVISILVIMPLVSIILYNAFCVSGMITTT